MRTRHHLVAAALATALLSACAGEPTTTTVRTDAPSVSPAARARIDALTDCSALQREFDVADANGNLSAMRLANARMAAVGCYP